jgi:hypothetical protein
MNIRESINRGFNLLAVSIVGLSGFAFLPEIFLEHDIPDKVDDIVLLVLGIVGIFWYRQKNNRFARSRMPLILVGLALLTKIGALIIEFNDAASVGDDFGALILFVLSFGLVWYQYSKTKKLLESSQ